MDHLNPPQEVLEAMRLEGFLDKAKPDSIIPINQKRYFKFIEDGRVLAYAGKAEDFDKGQIKGQILLRDILEVSVDPSNPKKFEVVVPDRVYKFSSKDGPLTNKWVHALQSLNKYEIDREYNWEKYLKDLDPDFVVEETINTPDEKTEFFLLQPLSFLTNTAKKVVVDGAVGTAVGIMKKGVKGVGELFADMRPKENQEYLIAKKLNETFDKIAPKLLKSRIKMGILLREVKEATGLGLVDNLMNDTGMREMLARRWCLLVSSKPILHHEVDLTDEATLEPAQIPSDLHFDTLYFYDESCDNSAPVDIVKMKDVVHVVVKKKLHTEGQFRFVLDLGEKKFNLLCPSFADMDMWLRAIQASRATAREYEKSQFPTLKNLFWTLKIKDGNEGEKKLNNKIQDEYDILTKDNATALTSHDVKPLILIQEDVARDFIASIDACLSYRQPRTDVIQNYTDIYHEGILNSLKVYFNRNAADLENGDIFEMIRFLTDYQKNLLIFGSTFGDQRIKDGVLVLSKIAARKNLKANIRAIGNILLKQTEEEPELDARGRLVTTSPKDVMKILNDALNVFNYCNATDFILQILENCQNCLQYFINGLEVVIEKAGLSNEQLISICNDAMSFGTNIKDFVGTLLKLTGQKADIISLHFNDKNLIKNFDSVGKKSVDKIAENIFIPVTEEHKQKSFLQVELLETVNGTLQTIEDLVEKIHPTYATKLRSALLKQTVTFYVQSFLNSAEKKTIKKEHLKDITNKLASANSIIKDAYKPFRDIKGGELEKVLEPIEEFEDFMTRNYELLSLAVQNMKQSYGSFIKWSTIEHLLKFREAEIPKEHRDETMNNCKEIFKMTEASSGDQDKFNVFKKVDQITNLTIDTATPTGDTTSTPSSGSSTPKRRSFRQSTNTTIFRLQIEGYLGIDGNFFKNMMGILSGGRTDSRYFSIRKEFMYCYKDSNSESSLMTFSLKDAEECIPEEKARFVLKVKEDGSIKEYKFIAENEHKRDLWVQTINNVMKHNLVRSKSVMLDDTDTDIYKDDTPLFIEIEKMPSLKFEYSKDMRARAETVRLNRAETLKQKNENAKAKNTQSGATTASTTDSTGSSKRKKSLTFLDGDFVLEDDLDVKPKPGFCGGLCMRLGFVKPKGTMK